MKYYILKKDKRYTDVPKIINWFGRINTEHAIRMEYDRLEKMYTLLLQENDDMYQADAIFEPIFLVSEMVKYCIEKYEPNVKNIFVGVIERKNNTICQFYLPHLTEQRCLSDKSIITGNGTILEKPVFDMNKIDKNKYIFRIGELGSVHIAMREELAESILRRGAKGIQFVSVEIEE